MGKTVEIEFSEFERFTIFMHFTRNVNTNTGREQDEYDDIWTTLQLDEIDSKIKSFGRAPEDADFSKEIKLDCTFTKEEIGYFIKFCERPMPGALSRFVRPIRIKIAEARDRAGLKAVPSEQTE